MQFEIKLAALSKVCCKICKGKLHVLFSERIHKILRKISCYEKNLFQIEYIYLNNVLRLLSIEEFMVKSKKTNSVQYMRQFKMMKNHNHIGSTQLNNEINLIWSIRYFLQDKKKQGWTCCSALRCRKRCPRVRGSRSLWVRGSGGSGIWVLGGRPQATLL